MNGLVIYWILISLLISYDAGQSYIRYIIVITDNIITSLQKQLGPLEKEIGSGSGEFAFPVDGVTGPEDDEVIYIPHLFL